MKTIDALPLESPFDLEDTLKRMGATMSVLRDGPDRHGEGIAILRHGSTGVRILLRYDYERMTIGWGPTFDRWANSRNWVTDIPQSKAELLVMLDECLRQVAEIGGYVGRGDAPDKDPMWRLVHSNIELTLGDSKPEEQR